MGARAGSDVVVAAGASTVARGTVRGAVVRGGTGGRVGGGVDASLVVGSTSAFGAARVVVAVVVAGAVLGTVGTVPAGALVRRPSLSLSPPQPARSSAVARSALRLERAVTTWLG